MLGTSSMIPHPSTVLDVSPTAATPCKPTESTVSSQKFALPTESSRPRHYLNNRRRRGCTTTVETGMASPTMMWPSPSGPLTPPMTVHTMAYAATGWTPPYLYYPQAGSPGPMNSWPAMAQTAHEFKHVPSGGEGMTWPTSAAMALPVTFDWSDPRLVWLSRLPAEWSEVDLDQWIQQSGAVRFRGIMRDPVLATSLGTGYIFMHRLDDALTCLERDGDVPMEGYPPISVTLPNMALDNPTPENNHSFHVPPPLSRGQRSSGSGVGEEVRRLDKERFEVRLQEQLHCWGNFLVFLRHRLATLSETSQGKNAAGFMQLQLEIVSDGISEDKQSTQEQVEEPLKEGEEPCQLVRGKTTSDNDQNNYLLYKLQSDNKELIYEVIHYALGSQSLEEEPGSYETCFKKTPPSPSSGETDPVLQARMYKTRLCNSWLRYQQITASMSNSRHRDTKTFLCPRGDECPYAHGYKELRQNPLYKTRLCEMFWISGECKFEQKGGCHFAHSLDELKMDSVENEQQEE